VLTAYQEVEDNLAALRNLERESGTEGLDVAAAETAALQARLTAISIRTRRLSAAVMLVKALGGGWRRSTSPPDARAAANR
jgi:outer membrane protein TolC